MPDPLAIDGGGMPSPRALPGGGPSLQQAAQSFEAYFIQVLLKEMRDTIPGGGAAGSGFGGGIYQSIMDEALAASLSQAGGLGLARVLAEHVAGQNEADPQVFKGIDR